MSPLQAVATTDGPTTAPDTVPTTSPDTVPSTPEPEPIVIAVPTKEAVNEAEASWGDYGELAILCLLNILNYADRWTMASVLPVLRREEEFNLTDAYEGLLQTFFICSFVVAPPIAGYFGDRYNRKWLIVGGMTTRIISVVWQSVVPARMFWLLCMSRTIMGLGMSVAATIVPALIADMFSESRRSRAIMIFYFACPVGAGLGYILGSQVFALSGGLWRWGVRSTLPFSAIALVLFIMFVRERPRGATQMRNHGEMKEHSIKKDLKALFTNPTFILFTLGYTAVIFDIGTLAWFGPKMMGNSVAAQSGIHNAIAVETKKKYEDITADVGLKFGMVVVLSGFFGVALGSMGSMMLSKGQLCCRLFKTKLSDAIVGIVSAFVSMLTLFALTRAIAVSDGDMERAEKFMRSATMTTRRPVTTRRLTFNSTPSTTLSPTNTTTGALDVNVESISTAALIWVFLINSGFSAMFPISAEVVIKVVTPNRRSLANGILILISHILGDASGPPILGMVSDHLMRGNTTSHQTESMLKAFYICDAMLLVAILFFIAAAFTEPTDINRCEQEIDEVSNKQIAETASMMSMVHSVQAATPATPVN